MEGAERGGEGGEEEEGEEKEEVGEEEEEDGRWKRNIITNRNLVRGMSRVMKTMIRSSLDLRGQIARRGAEALRPTAKTFGEEMNQNKKKAGICAVAWKQPSGRSIPLEAFNGKHAVGGDTLVLPYTLVTRGGRFE